jgi:predicted restriction endonuclease
MFAKLRTERGGAPRKPFLLLSVMDLIAQGRITKDLIEPSYELIDTFSTYWVAIMPPGLKTSADFPLLLTSSMVRSIRNNYHEGQWPSG